MLDNVQFPSQEAFKARELEILRYIANGWSNREIANKLYLSVNTVRWYNKQTYAKLGAQNRTMAVARAREWGLLDDENGSSQSESIPSPREVFFNVPTPTTPFIGREDDLTIVTHLLADPTCRLLSLVGAGGMGKTRLAIEIAARVRDAYADGVVFVNLSPINTVADMLPTIAQAIGCQLREGNPPKQQLFNFLESHQQLLILDNLEQLIEGVPLISDILEAASDVTILATSRESLHLREETLYRVEGLDITSDDDELEIEASNAVQLFVQRARQVQPEFAVDDGTLDAIVEICHLVDGMPLGIELAAAWIAMLSPHEIADEIRQSFDFLETEIRNMPQRHRSMRVVFESAWQLLTAEEQAVLAKLSVFRGGPNREAAESVANSSLRTLMALVNKSLLYRGDDGRFHLHELLRQYAEEQLNTYGDIDGVRVAHSHYYLNMLYERREEMWTARSEAFLDDIAADFENIRAAWGWSVIKQDFSEFERALESIYEFCIRRIRLYEALAMFDSKLAQLNAKPDQRSLGIRLRLYGYRGRIRSSVGQFEGALADFEVVRTAAQAAGNTVLEREALVPIGKVFRRMDQHEDAKNYLKAALHLARQSHDERAVAEVLYHLGTVSWGEGDNIVARAYHQEAVHISRRLGLRDKVAMQALHGLGETECMSADFDTALALTNEALQLAYEMGEGSYIAENLQNIGWIHVGSVGFGDYDKALDLITQSLAISQTAHLEWHTSAALNYRGLIVGVRGDYGRGIAFLDECRVLSETVRAWRFLSATLDSLGYLYQDLNLLAEAEAVHQRGIEIAEAYGSRFWLPRLQANLAIDQLRQGDHSVGDDLKAALQSAVDKDQRLHVPRCLDGLAEWALASGDAASALDYATELRQFAELRRMREMAAQAYRWQCAAYRELGQFEAAEKAGQAALELGVAIGRVRLLWDIHTEMVDLYQVQGKRDLMDIHAGQRREIVGQMVGSLDEPALQRGLMPYLA